MCCALYVAGHAGADGVLSLDFIENRNQWDSHIRYKANIPGGEMYLTDSGFIFSYYNEDDFRKIHDKIHEGKDVRRELIHGHAYRVNFTGANPAARNHAESRRSYYYNYFIGNDSSRWAGGVPLYGKVVQANIYDGIDLVVYSSGRSLKYDLLVAPGADPRQILVKYEGVTPVLQSDGSIRIVTSVNTIKEEAPYTYQWVNGQKKEVASRYVLKNGQLYFDFPEGYDPRYPLVIDPSLIFSTFSNSSGTDGGSLSYGSAYDALGNMYAGMLAWKGLPVTPGAFQTSWGDEGIVGIQKISADGSALIYCTYYGGAVNRTHPNSLAVNDRMELVVTGMTESATIPVTPGCFDNTLNGAWDLYVAHFNASGTALLGATYIGGDGLEATGQWISLEDAKVSPCEVAFDDSGNIYVISNTNSLNFPVTTDAFQTALSGSLDGFIIKLDPSCSKLLYSSYLGGSGDDSLYGLWFNSKGQIVVCGATTSPDFPTTPGVLHTSSPGGATDGFVCIIDPDKGLVHSSYLGTNQADYAFRCQVDRDDHIYVMGRTLGNYPIHPTGVYARYGTDMFIDKLAPDLSASLRSTRIGNTIGGGIRFIPTAFLLDDCGNICIAGMNPMPIMLVTDDAYQKSHRQFWFCVLQPDFAGLMYATYFGTSVDHSHEAVHRFDPHGRLYHSLCSNADTFPITPGVFGPVKLNGLNQDCISYKFDFGLPSVRSSFATANGLYTGCAPFTPDIVNTSTVADSFLWDFGNGSFSSLRSPSYTYHTPGTYRIRLYAWGDSGCITRDTFERVITVLPVPGLTLSGDMTICKNASVQLHAGVQAPSGMSSTIIWSPSAGLDDPASFDPVATLASDITYRAVVTLSNGCRAEDSLRITVVDMLGDFGLENNDTAICLGDAASPRVRGDERFRYSWTPVQGVSDPATRSPLITPDSSRTYFVTVSAPGCPDSTVSFHVSVQPVPEVYAGNDTMICYGENIRLSPAVQPADYPFYTWTWTPPGGLNPGANVRDPFFAGVASTTLTLTVSTPAGCTGSDDVLIQVQIPDMHVSADTAICPGDTVQLRVWGNHVFHVWRPGVYISDTLAPTPYIYPPESRTYTVYGQDADGCGDTRAVHVRVLPAALVSLPDSVRIARGSALRLDPAGNCLYFEWFPESGLSDPRVSNPVATPDVHTRYIVNARTEDGCPASDAIDVFVEDDAYIDVPNAFAPGSGPNGRLRPVHYGRVTLHTFSVYNRWGVKVYETGDLNDGWDGMYQGVLQPAGVYVYTVEATTVRGRYVRKQGNVTLLR